MIIELENKKVFSSDVGQSFDKNKQTIILLHGSGQSHVVWSLVDQYLSDEGYNIFNLDLPGHGNSEGKCLKSIEEMADWVEKIVSKIGINNLCILGHSQGCLVALEYAHRFPGKLKSLIFVAGSYEIPVNKSLITLAQDGDMDSLNLMMKWGYGYSKQFIGGNPLQKILNSSREVREVLAVDLKACNNYKNGINVVNKIKIPTFFVFGELDKMIALEKGIKFSRLISGSKTHIIKDCGHMLILENPFEMREKVAEFLKQ